MKVKLKILRQPYQSENYNIFTFKAIEPKLLLHPVYHSTTIKGGNISFLSVGNTYELELEPLDDYTYQLISSPSLNIDDLTPADSLSILKECTSETNANELLSNYPNIISLLVSDQLDQIDVEKLHNIKTTRLNEIADNVKLKYKYCSIQQSLKQYNLTFSEAKILGDKYINIQNIQSYLNEHPYECLCQVLERGFERVDALLLKLHPNLSISDERAEFAIVYQLNLNETSGSTYMSANDMAKSIYEFAPEIISKLKDICIQSDRIYYDEKTNKVAKMSTYKCEQNIADFVKEHMLTPNKWDFDVSNYKQLGAFEMTDEQLAILQSVCDNNITIVNAIAGSGKSSALKAVVKMCEDYGKSCCIVAPTGRVSKVVSELSNHSASTIHRRVMQSDIFEDVLICEEFSMISNDLLDMLLSSIGNENIKILFVGDLNQISAIGVGSPMRDIVNSGKVPVCSLSKVFRFNEGGLSKISCDVHNSVNYLSNCNKNRQDFGTKRDYTFVKTNNTTQQIVDEYAGLLKSYKPDEITIVTPWNKYEMGSININNAIQKLVNPVEDDAYIKRLLNKQEIKFHIGDIVLNTKNDYSMPLAYSEATTAIFNGEIGHIIDISDNLLYIKFDEQIVMFNKDATKHLLLGYCVNSYKLQGSQNKAIIVITNKQHEEYLNKNIMYTNLTRAQEKLIEVGDLTTIEKCVTINSTEQRNTQLKEMLLNE